MALEVARAYDENKNLVPLYILTDGEVPEVSPGFDISASSDTERNITIQITVTSSNPTGGNAVTPTPIGYAPSSQGTKTITIYNKTKYNLSVLVSSEFEYFYITTSNPITIQANSNGTVSYRTLSTSPDPTPIVCGISILS